MPYTRIGPARAGDSKSLNTRELPEGVLISSWAAACCSTEHGSETVSERGHFSMFQMSSYAGVGLSCVGNWKRVSCDT